MASKIEKSKKKIVVSLRVLKKKQLKKLLQSFTRVIKKVK